MIEVESLRSEGEALAQELARDAYEVRAGLSTEGRSSAIWERSRWSWIPTRDTFEAVRRAQSEAVLPEVGARLGRLAAWIARSIDEAAAREIDDRRVETEAGLQAVVRDERLGLHALPGRIGNTDDRALRSEQFAALEGLWRALTPLVADGLALGREAVEALGLGRYPEAVGTLAGIDLRALADGAEELLRATDDLHRDALAEMARRSGLRQPLAQLAVHDLWWLNRMRARDGLFHPADLTRRCLGVIEKAGLDPLARGRIRLDLEERPNKAPRAFCVALRMPQEIVVVLQPRGGVQDYRTLLHEMGHALHRAHTGAALPFEDRWLGDASVTEGWAELWGKLVGRRTFLTKVMGLARRESEIPARELATVDLGVARRHAAKLLVELELHAGAQGSPDRYAEALSRACAIPVGPARWAVDVDPGFYSARYLRAWQLEALAQRSLRERFDEDWFCNPRTGPFLQGQWALGQSLDATELARTAFGGELRVADVVQSYEEALR